MEPQNILITGSSGLLGYPLAKHFAEEGRAVVGLDIVGPPNDQAPFTAVTGDVGDVHLVYRLFKEHRFDGVVHCGGVSGPMLLPDEPFTICRVNVFATVHLFEAMRVFGLKRFVYCSSVSAYGEPSMSPVTEDAPFHPTSVYGATKAACDVILRAYRVEHGLDTVALRIGTVYGPGRQTESLIRTLIEDALAGRPTRMPTADWLRFHYVYRDDVVAALLAALDADSLPLPRCGAGMTTRSRILAILAVTGK